MTRRSHPTDAELIRYLEGEVTQSRAGQIVVLAQSSAAERKRLEAMERMLDLVAQPDERVVEIDLVDAVHQQLAHAEAGVKVRHARAPRALLALGAIVAAVLLISMPRVLDDPGQPEPELRKLEVERQILSWLELDEKR
jgi:hypothetical protein